MNTAILLDFSIGITLLVIATLLVYHYTKSYLLVTVTSFIIGEAMFTISTWIVDWDGFLWFVILFVIPFAHFASLVSIAHSKHGTGG